MSQPDLAAELSAAWEQNRDDWAERVITLDDYRRRRDSLLARAVLLPPADKARLPGWMQHMLWPYMIITTSRDSTGQETD